MSWFQTTNLASFAKTALKEAQKTIDKALDISEEEDAAAANNSSGGGSSARAAAVTEMASEFFASWGVAGITSPTKGSIGNSTESSSSSNVVGDGETANYDNNRAISTPPKRCSTMDDLLLANHHQNSNSSSLTSDVPVTLLASSTNSAEEHPVPKNDQDQLVQEKNVTSSKHTRSLSDTVFHASDDSNNLGDLVQVLDDSSTLVDVASDNDPVPSNSPQPYNSILSHDESGSTGSSSRLIDTLSSHAPDNSSSMVLIPSGDVVSVIKDTSNGETEARSNLELLQEIDLDGGNLVGLDDETEESKFEAGPNFTSSSTEDAEPSTKNSNIVETSGLSDGWDWTSTTESCLVVTQEEEEKPVKPTPQDTLTVETLQDKNDDEKSSLDSRVVVPPADELLQVVDNNEQQQQSLVSLSDEAASASPPPSSSVSSPKLIPVPQLSSSRAASPHDHPGEVGGEGESTPPSSARVSPNFEMVSSGCAASTAGGGSGSNLPESSRSSSIVVVSGRESTLNSRGTSGAGSSGSSEGGHDIVDGEGQSQTPHSPAVSASGEFPRITKHKKGASSSSSSDIEVIPSDYSSSSSVPPHLLHQHHQQHPSKLLPHSDIACQTDLAEIQTRECEVQTEVSEEEEAVTPKPVEADISQFVSTEMADILAEKDAEVQQLREEGEKLSIKQYELSQVIKKLRAKERENEGVIKGLRTEMATKNLELEKLMKTFISKEGIEQSQNETISKLNQERRRLELQVEQQNSELEDARDNVESMKATVENASIEILELKNVISSVQRESAEVDRLTREKAELISRTESLQREVDHLRSTLNSSHSSHHSREAELKSQISGLTQKIHQLETKLGDISSEVADATMPLSLEIEKLQGELKQQVAQADRREQTMQSTIADLELKLKTASERERSAKELQIQFQSQHSTLELRIDELEARNRSLQEQLQQKDEIYGKKLEDKNGRCQKLEKTVERLTGEVERLSSENDALSNELKAERNNLEVERRRISQTLFVDTRENNNFQGQGGGVGVRPATHPHHVRSSSMSTTASSTLGGGSQQNQGRSNAGRNDNSRENSPSEHSLNSEEASYLDEVFDPNSGMLIGGNGNNRSMTPKSFFESFSSAGLIENLQAQLRQREGEVLAFQEELSKNEKIRKQLNEEIANLTIQNQQLGLEMEKLTEMEQRLEELDKNYNAVLQMYGEKVEEADELRMDLEDVKEMYKAQIEQLLKKS